MYAENTSFRELFYILYFSFLPNVIFLSKAIFYLFFSPACLLQFQIWAISIRQGLFCKTIFCSLNSNRCHLGSNNTTHIASRVQSTKCTPLFSKKSGISVSLSLKSFECQKRMKKKVKKGSQIRIRKHFWNVSALQ